MEPLIITFMIKLYGFYYVIPSIFFLSFSISVLEIFLPLLNGGVLVLVNQSTQKDPFHLIDVIKETGVTVVQATPTTYEVSEFWF